MTPNRTSATVHELQKLGQCAYLIDGESYPLQPILERYQMMERALKFYGEYPEDGWHEIDADRGSIARDALAFDPLSPPNP